MQPGEKVIYQGHPSWRAIIGFYLKGTLVAAAAGVLAALIDSSTGLGLVTFVVIVARHHPRRLHQADRDRLHDHRPQAQHQGGDRRPKGPGDPARSGSRTSTTARASTSGSCRSATSSSPRPAPTIELRLRGRGATRAGRPAGREGHPDRHRPPGHGRAPHGFATRSRPQAAPRHKSLRASPFAPEVSAWWPLGRRFGLVPSPRHRAAESARSVRSQVKSASSRPKWP